MLFNSENSSNKSVCGQLIPIYYFLDQFFPYSDLIIYQSKHYIKISMFCSMNDLLKIFVAFHIEKDLVWVRLDRISPLNLYLEMVPHNVRTIFTVYFWSPVLAQQKSAWLHHYDTMLLPYLGNSFFPHSWETCPCFAITQPTLYLKTGYRDLNGLFLVLSCFSVPLSWSSPFVLFKP